MKHQDCSWCGASTHPDHQEVGAVPCRNREGEVFCRPSHRAESNAALKRLRVREGGAWIWEHGMGEVKRTRKIIANCASLLDQTPLPVIWVRDHGNACRRLAHNYLAMAWEGGFTRGFRHPQTILDARLGILYGDASKANRAALVRAEIEAAAQ